MVDEKNIDESWKESVVSEKEKSPSGKTADAPAQQPGAQSSESAASSENAQAPEINFIGYMTSLAYQAMVFLGAVPSPIDNTTEVNLPQAQFMIDTLQLLKEKTAGNLTQQEDDTINTFLYQLQMKFAEVSKQQEKK